MDCAASHSVRALVLTERDRITYRSRTTNQCYQGQVLRASSEEIQIQLDGVSELKTVKPDEFWRVSTSAVVNSRKQQQIEFLKTGQSVVYTARSNGQLYLGKVTGPSVAGGVMLQLDGAPHPKEVSPTDLWRVQSHDSRGADPTRAAHANTTPDSGPVPARSQNLSKSLEEQSADILRSGGIRLVSAIWLLRQDENFRVRRLQDLPEEAFLDCDFAAELILSGREAFTESQTRPSAVRVVALSYRWLDQNHPDPDGIQLAKLLQYLKVHIAAILDEEFPVLRGSPERQIRQRDIDVGVLWDFMSLNQRPYRNDAEEAQFSLGLGCINKMYGMESSTMTLQLKAVPEGINPYERSGWCCFEEAVSGIIKKPELLIVFQDRAVPIAHHSHAQYWESKTKRRPFDEMVRNKTLILDSLGLGAKAKDLVYTGTDDWGVFVIKCSDDRQPPMHPDDMAELLLNESKVVFTNKTDSSKVSDLYREFFGSLVSQRIECKWAPRMSAGSIGKLGRGWLRNGKPFEWSAGQMERFAKSLGAFKICGSLDVSGLSLTPQNASAFLKEARLLPSLRKLCLCGDDLARLKSCPDMAELVHDLDKKGIVTEPC